MKNTGKTNASMLMRAALAGAAIACAMFPAAISAADWHLNSSITGEFIYDNNFRLDPSNQETLWGFNTRPGVGIESHAPRTDLYLNGRLNYGYFPEKTDENSFDQSGDLSLIHRTERSEFSIGGNLSHATTRTTEDEDTGRDFSDANRFKIGGNASWSYSLTELVGAGLQGGGSYVTYDTSVLDDYRTFFGGPFVTIRLTERDSVRLNATYSRYDRLSGLDYASDLFVANANWTHVFHPQWEVSLRAGGSYVSSDEETSVGSSTVTISEENAGFDGGATITYTEERASISGSFSHAIEPSGVGELVMRNSVGLSASYKVAPLITFDFKTSFIQQSALQGEADDRNFVSAEPGVSWQFLPDWHARVAYRFRTQTLGDEERAYSNGGLASVTWNLPAWGANQAK